MTQNQIKKNLLYLSLGELGILDDLKSLNSWDRDSETAIKISVQERGSHTSYVAVKKDEEYILIDGRLRYQVELDLHGPEHIVPVWVHEGDFTEEGIQFMVFDLDKRKKKPLTHIMDEYIFLDDRFPNNQGKKNAEALRKNEIAKRIGVSTSKLDQVKRLNAAEPYLLRAVDMGDMTLKKALAEAKRIEKMREEQELTSDFDEPTSHNREITAYNHHVDLNAVMTNCPCCGLPFDRIEWSDVPEIFSYKRGENEKQTDWLKAIA